VIQRSDITLSQQLKQRSNWKDAMVDAVVATFCFKDSSESTSGSVFDDFQWLVTKRVKGAESGQFQAHHGGFLKVTDVDIWDGACRELSEETGYKLRPANLVYLTSVGPAVYRSEMYLDDTIVTLDVSRVEAESSTAFSVPLFITNVTGCNSSSETDGEVIDHTWMTAREIIQTYGLRGSNEYSRFNYFQMFLPALLFVVERWQPGQRAFSEPGSYSFSF